MHPEMPLLFELHEVDARILQLEHALRNLDNGDRAKAAVLAARQEYARRDDDLKRAKVAMANADTALKSNETKQAQLKKRLYGGTITSTREAEAVEHEMAGLKEQASELETAILETMEVIEAGEAGVVEQQNLVAESEALLKTTLAAFARDSASIREQIDATAARRGGALKPISPAVVARYDAARRRTRDTGVTMLEGHICSACRMQVAGINVAGLLSTDEIMACDNCGRLLYRRA
ncbi:MAG TPA: hypothetical protein VGM37_04555 [Armatimonadota bacterium]|jgi:hypothetical protein